MSEPQKNSALDRLLNRLSASRFFTVSLLFHVMLVIASGSFIIFKAVKEPEAMGVSGDMEFLTQGTGQVEAPPENEVAPPPRLDQVADTTPAISNLPTTETASNNISSALDSLITTSATTSSFSVVSAPSTGGTSISNVAASAQNIGKVAAKAGRIAPLGGGSSNVSFFGIKKQGRRFAFLLDASGSMLDPAKGGKAGYDNLKAQLVGMIDKLDPTTEFNVFIFDEHVDQFQKGAVPATPDIKTEFARWLQPYMETRHGVLKRNFNSNRLVGYGGTTRMDVAIAGAIEMGADVVFILTDGTPSVHRPATKEELEEHTKVREKNKAALDAWQAETKTYNEKYKDVIAEMRKEINRRNASLENRTKEKTYWIEGFKGLPPNPSQKAPPGAWTPKPYLTQEDLVKLLESMVAELYPPAGIPRPSVNAVGYSVSDKDKEWLKTFARKFSGKYDDFDMKRR